MWPDAIRTVTILNAAESLALQHCGQCEQQREEQNDWQRRRSGRRRWAAHGAGTYPTSQCFSITKIWSIVSIIFQSISRSNPHIVVVRVLPLSLTTCRVQANGPTIAPSHFATRSPPYRYFSTAGTSAGGASALTAVAGAASAAFASAGFAFAAAFACSAANPSSDFAASVG